jgi:hypothetical protein
MVVKEAARLCVGTVGVLLMVGLCMAAQPWRPPDLTQGGKKDGTHDWTLGPTGARGWIWGRGLETTEARQVLITKVDKGSPADGVLEADDVILGVGGKPFESDARKALGSAITEAERTENKGILKLIRWRKGKSEEVSVQLKVMGAYGAAAPYDCPKSRLILEQGCRYLAGRELRADIVGEVNALALLASGKPEFLDKVKALARKVGRPDLKLALKPGMFAWDWGYANLLLTEYYLATGDKEVLPAIREYSTAIAKGQSAVGTWGHGMSLPGDFGRLGGYGAINSAGLPCWLSMALGRKCGVTDRVVGVAVDRSHAFFRFYVGKGGIPYGDHPPYWDLHDNNGKNAMAAVAFDLLGDREGTRFFSRMSAAAYDEREFGHTGNYFSYLWGPLGVARAGPEAVAAHLREQQWYYDLARRWDGGFTYQGGAGESDSYDNWDMTGAFLLTYALPLEKLYVTGRGTNKANWLAGKELQAVIEDGRGFAYSHQKDCYAAKSDEELLKRLDSWSPAVRFRAASALAKKPGDFVAPLMRMLASDRLTARLGACEALEYLRGKAAPATDELIKQLSAEDQWLSIRAAYALASIGAAARKAVPELLRGVLDDDTASPRAMKRRYLGMALFMSGYADNAPRRGLLADSLEGVDRQMLYPAVRRMLEIDDGLARSQMACVYARLSDEELQHLWPDIVRAVERPAPSGEMFADGIREAGLRLLAKHHVKEGMHLCIEYAKNQNPWASQERMGGIMAALKTYGAAAKEVLPELRALAEFCRNEKDFPEDCKNKKTAAVEEAIRAIEAAKDQPELRTIAPLLLKANPKT